MSTETTNGIALPGFKGSENEFWDPTPPEVVNFDQLIEPTTENLTKPKPNPVDFVKRQNQRPKQSRRQDDPDKYLLQAKALVVQNYNEHRDPRRSQVLTMDQVYITFFAKALRNWKAVVGSTTVRGLLWEVSYNGSVDEGGDVNEAYLDVYKKISHVKIPLG